MLDLFIRKKLFELNSTVNGEPIQVQNVIFQESSHIKPSHAHKESPKKRVSYRFLLCCNNNQILLCHVKDNHFENAERMWIPTDPDKGKIVSFSFNPDATECILLSAKTFIYRIPLQFRVQFDDENHVHRRAVDKSALVIHSCSLTKPTAILWWERMGCTEERRSIAIVANGIGQICLLNLTTKEEFRKFNVPFAVESLHIYEEIYSRTLLINCARSFQYFIVLEHFKNAPTSRLNSLDDNTKTVSPFQYGYYLKNPPKSSRNEFSDGSVFDKSVRPQQISVKEEEKKNNDSEGNKAFDDFIEIFESDLLISLHPQESDKFVYLVKQCKTGFDFESESSSSPKSTVSNEFCSISKKERNFDIYEFNSKEFCSEKLFLNSATKYFYVGLNIKSFTDSDAVGDSRFLKIINCGERFMVLVFTKFVVIVSKHFAEQKCLSAHSPRSPLVLKKSDSFRNSGSFRRKNYSAHNPISKSNSLPLTSVVETFTPDDGCAIFDNNDEIVNVFFTTRTLSSPPAKCKICSKNERTTHPNDIERIFNIEVSSVEHKLDNDVCVLFHMEEQFIIFTKNGTCHYISCQEKTFGDYFHNRICELLNLPDNEQTTCVDGDIITNAKYIVDCFLARTTMLNVSKSFCRLHQTNISPQNRQTTWQFWITRSGLILLRELSKIKFDDNKFRKVLRLFELARTPRRRVITSLIYFRFWSQALYFLRKYFETSILQELNGEERLFLSHQMFNCLMKNVDDPELPNEKSMEELLKFLKDYFSYYDIEIIFVELLKKKLFNVAKYVAKINYSHVQLIEIVLQDMNHGKYDIDRDEMLEFLTDPDIGYHLVLSACYPSDPIMEDRIFSLNTFEHYLDFVLKRISQMEFKYISRLERIFDPTQIPMQTFMHKILKYSENGWVSQSPDRLIEKRDIINLYIFILIMSFRREETEKPDSDQFYDWNFLKDVEDNFGRFKHQQLIPVSTAKSKILLCCGAYFSLLSISNSEVNRVFLWGKFPYSHPCDSAPENSVRSSRTPIMLKYFTYILPPSSIHAIAAGAQHILFLTDFGIYVLGSSTYGQLGLGVTYRRTRLPAPIKCFSITTPNHVKIVKIACGSYHSLAVSECGQLYVWGWALHGQLGIGLNEDVFSPVRIDFWDKLSVKVADVSAGYAHSLVLCDNGDLYVFGDNSYNQLGVELDTKATKSTVPVKMCNIHFGTIRLISCGLYHTIVLAVDDSTQEQKVFSWGLDPKTWRLKMRSERKSDPAVRGSSNLKDFSSPMEISLGSLENDQDSRIVKICSGQAHNVLLTQDGRVLSFGFGREGQLGLGPDTSNSRVSAKIVPELFQVSDISVGVVHSLAVTEDALWGWGQNAEMNSFAHDENEQSGNKTNRTHQEEFWSSKLASYQKNNESIPYKIVSFQKLLQNRVKSCSIFKDLNMQTLFYPESSNASTLDKLKMCMIRYSQKLDYQQNLLRFENFHLKHLFSVLCFAKNEIGKAFSTQINALKSEFDRQTSLGPVDFDKYFEEFKNLSIFFMETLPKKHPQDYDISFSHLKTILESWSDFSKGFIEKSGEKLTIKRLLSELYLNGHEHITTPYFGLNLMKLISLDENVRQQFDFDDQFLLDVLTQTASLTKKNQGNIVKFQVFMDEFSQVSENMIKTPTHHASTIDSDLAGSETQKSNLNFPLELVWRKNMAMLLKEDAK